MPPGPTSDLKSVGIVLSGGGTRAAYQVGALKALGEFYPNSSLQVTVIMASSIGAVNAILIGACLKKGLKNAVLIVEQLWRERTYGNTFRGSLSVALLRSLKLAFLQYFAPGPKPTAFSLFDPTPVIERIDGVLTDHGGAEVKSGLSPLRALGVMTTQEGKARRALLLVTAQQTPDSEMLRGTSYDLCYFHRLTAAHAFASAALPSVLPAVELSLETGQVNLVDGGICENIPVDPALRFGAESIVIIDVSGRKWWNDHYAEPHDQLDPWESPAQVGSHCMRPTTILELRNRGAFGPVLRDSIGKSTRDQIHSLGPSWPILKLLKKKMGEVVAYEVISYAVIHQGFIEALIDMGYQETMAVLRSRTMLEDTKLSDPNPPPLVPDNF